MAVLEDTKQNMMVFVNMKLAGKFGVGLYKVLSTEQTDNGYIFNVVASKQITEEEANVMNNFVKELSTEYYQQLQKPSPA